MTPTADVAVAGRTGPLCEASSDRSSTIASQAIVARVLQPNFRLYDRAALYTVANLILALQARRPSITVALSEDF